MRERARAYGGDCTVDSTPGAGTRVRLRIPA
jgi:signal transduction histidine kinase